MNAPQHLRTLLASWICRAALLCHPSLQGISQPLYKKGISIPSILTIILICLNWHSPVDSLFKSYIHYYVFIPWRYFYCRHIWHWINYHSKVYFWSQPSLAEWKIFVWKKRWLELGVHNGLQMSAHLVAYGKWAHSPEINWTESLNAINWNGL